MTLQLNQNSLSKITADVSRPSYDFRARKAGIVHIGIGAFHKAHQATFTDDMMAKSPGDYKIIAVSLRSAKNRDLLKQQDYLYTAIERSNAIESARIIGALQTVLVAPEDPQAVIDALSDPNIKVVTTTITEKGYCLLPGNTGLNLQHPDIHHDLANLDSPKTMIGFVVKACVNRHQQGLPGFAFISCDNLPNNSQLAKKALIDFAKLVSNDLAEWIDTNLSFCNSMVDRIVPAVQVQDIEQHSKTYQYVDNALVSSEPFRQWVIEDKFKTERPPWELAGVLFVDDVEQYENLKLRYLNGSHSALAYLGKLYGHKYIHEAVANERLRSFVTSLMAEMKLSLQDKMTFDFDDYGATIIDRFSNKQIQYETQQVATDGSQKLPQRIFAPLEELLAKDHLSEPLCFVIAAWLCYLKGKSEDGSSYEVSDPLAEPLTSIMSDPTISTSAKLAKMLEIKGLFPLAIKQRSFIQINICEKMCSINANGVIAALPVSS
ncbi:mannitol dehydrogenase family protein [Thalassotalea litorea]|uniref:mannitol dehydrogenase family protein n=1 Tax=Thalassotalea litorea TaxID=2020715 RepID=UPI003735851B